MNAGKSKRQRAARKDGMEKPETEVAKKTFKKRFHKDERGER
jgi:hypothetical protein